MWSNLGPRRRLALLLTGALAAAALGIAYGLQSRDLTADPNDPELVALGAGIYAEYCAACHGAELEGQPD